METIEETEDRIARTLAAVAEQTNAEADQPPILGDTGGSVVSIGVERKPRTVLLVAAAAAVAAVGLGIGALAVNGGGTVDTAATGTDADVSTTTSPSGSTSTSASPESDVAVIELTAEAPADGRPLRLILPEGYLPLAGAAVTVGDPGTVDAEGSAIAVGRPTETGVDEPVTIYLTQSTSGFSVEEGSETEIAGRTILNSHDEGVVEQVDDQRWVVYQTEFGDPKLAALVAATSVDGDRLIFSSDGPYKELARQESVDLSTITTTIAEVRSGDRTLTVALQTKSATGAELALLGSLSWWTPGVERIEIGGRPAYIANMEVPAEAAAGGEGSMAIIGWQPSEFHTAAILISGVDADEGINIVEGMFSVDADSWNAYWS